MAAAVALGGCLGLLVAFVAVVVGLAADRSARDGAWRRIATSRAINAETARRLDEREVRLDVRERRLDTRERALLP